MELNIKDITELLQVPERTVIKWIESGSLPAYRINNQYRFNRSEVNDWILKNDHRTSSKILDLSGDRKPVSLVELLTRGGVFHRVPGGTVTEVIRNIAGMIPLPAGLDRDAVVLSLIEREELMPTAIGEGMAIPHPRNPIISDMEGESITIGFLEHSIDYQAIDGQPVQTLFVVLSANPARHLEILSKISFLCHQQEFKDLLASRAAREDVVAYIALKEQEWTRKRAPHG